MDDKVKTAQKPESLQSEHEQHGLGWRPRIHDDYKVITNPFENFDISGGSVLDGAAVTSTTTIRDATEDTAPLQGSKDISDDDYLGGAA